MFEIECSIAEEIYYRPSLYELRESIKNSVSEGIQLVCTNEQFLHTLDFINKAYSNQEFDDKISTGEFNDLINLAISSETISKNCQSIYESVEKSFDKIIIYSKLFEEYIEFHVNNLKEDCTQYDEHEVFRKAIKDHLHQEELIENFMPIHDLLIYRLNSNSLKSEIRPSPGKCLMAIRDYLPKLSFQKLNSLCTELEEANLLLSRIPTNINEFVEIMKYLWKIDSLMENYTDRFQQVEQLHIVMDEYKIKLPEKNKSKFKDTHTALKSVRNKLEEGLDAGEANEIRFKKELDREIPKLENRIQECQEEINNQKLSDKEAKIEEVITLIDEYEVEVEAIKAKGKLVNDQQRFLEINEVYFETIDTLNNDFQLKKKLWYGLKQIITYTKEQEVVPVDFINVEEIQNNLANMVKMSTQCFMGLEGNEAAGMFKEIVDLMKNTVPIVGYLRDEALEERHWREINSILNTEEDIHSPEFTLRSLIDLDLSQKDRDAIGEIALKASKERELEHLYKKVQTDWKAVQFDIAPYKDSKDYHVIASTEEVMEVLEECMVSINTILTSRFGDHIRKEVEDFNSRNLGRFEMLIDEWMEFQKGWTYLESIFHSPDISKNLPNETKKFNHCDQSWKTIMRDISVERK